MDTITNQLSESTSLVIKGIIRDFPEFQEIENMEAKSIIAQAFAATQKLRADFLQWAFAVNVAEVHGEQGTITYKLPNGVSLRPEAMMMLEEDLIFAAFDKPDSQTGLMIVITAAIFEKAEHLKIRFADYLETLKNQLLFAQQL